MSRPLPDGISVNVGRELRTDVHFMVFDVAAEYKVFTHPQASRSPNASAHFLLHLADQIDQHKQLERTVYYSHLIVPPEAFLTQPVLNTEPSFGLVEISRDDCRLVFEACNHVQLNSPRENTALYRVVVQSFHQRAQQRYRARGASRVTNTSGDNVLTIRDPLVAEALSLTG